MILNGTSIVAARARGDVTIEAFHPDRLNAASYTYGLDPRLISITPQPDGSPQHQFETISDSGFLLLPGQLYLGCTHEWIGSNAYAMTLSGGAAAARLGIFTNVSADLGHCGAAGRWTLEITVVQPVRVYPFMPIGRVAFWTQKGEASLYSGRYLGDDVPVPNMDLRIITPAAVGRAA